LFTVFKYSSMYHHSSPNIESTRAKLDPELNSGLANQHQRNIKL
jgi:hypothetical protein